MIFVQFAAFLTLMLAIIFWNIHVALFLRQMRLHEPVVYADLGSPTVMGKRKSALPFIMFLWRREYRFLRTESVARMGRRIAAHLMMTLGLFVALFILAVIW